MSVMGSISMGLFNNLLTYLFSRNMLTSQNKRKIREIQEIISNFNKDFDNTILDTYTFQKCLEREELKTIIFERLFLTHTNESESLREFKKEISKDSISYVNNEYVKMGRNKLKEEIMFYDYFDKLIDMLIKIRMEILSFETNVQTSIITDEIRKSEDKIAFEIQKLKKDNPFADENICNIKDLIDMYKIDDAKTEISKTLESQYSLSESQIEELYFQRARICEITRNYDELKLTKDKIKKINQDSKYIAEIDYFITCHNKDEKKLKKILSQFKSYNYSEEKLILKEAYFSICVGNYKKLESLIMQNDDLKLEFIDYHEGYYYYGLYMIFKGNEHGNDKFYEKAIEQFKKAYDIRKRIIYKYNILKINSILFLKNKANYSTQKEKEVIYENINEFKEIKYITNYFYRDSLIDYWEIFVNLTSIINTKETLCLINEINESIKSDIRIKVLISYIYFINGMDKESKEILNDDWNYNVFSTINMFIILQEEKHWKEIIIKYNNINNSEIRNNSTIIALYMNAKYNISGYDEIKLNIKEYLKRNNIDIIILLAFLDIVLDSSDEEVFMEIINYLNQNIDAFHDYYLRRAADLLYKHGKNNELIKLIENRYEKSENLREILLRVYKDNKDNYNLRLIYDKIKSFYNKGFREINLLRFKVEIELDLRLPRKSLETLKEYDILYDRDDFYIYNYVYSKIEIKEYSGLDNEIEILLRKENPSFQMLVAFLKAKQELFLESIQIAIDILYKSYNNINEEILQNYIKVYFNNLSKINEIEEFKTVKINSIVTIKKDDIIRKIAIHQNKIVTESGENKFLCENYHKDDNISILLLKREKGKSVKLTDGEYEIIEIKHIYSYLNNFCIDKLTSSFQKQKLLWTISCDDMEKMVEELKIKLRSLKNNNDKKIENYNFGNKFGMPISYFSEKNIQLYKETIDTLFMDNEQHYYAGEVFIQSNKQYVFSLSSLIILTKLGLLDKLSTVLNKCFITNSVFNIIREATKEVNNNISISPGKIYLNEANNLNLYKYNDNDKDKIRNFWSDLLVAIDGFTIEDSEIDELDMYDYMGVFTLDEDIESIELSKKTNRILVCDDLFIRKVHNIVSTTRNTTNIVGFLISENLLGKEEILHLIEKLVKSKYLYPINADIIFDIYYWINSIENEQKRETYYNKFKIMYKNLSDKSSKKYYNSMLRDLIKKIDDKGLSVRWLYDLTFN